MIVGTWVWDAAGHRQVADWQSALEGCQAGGEGFVWIGMDEPDPAELERLAAQLHLHPLAVEDAEVGGQRAKIDSYDGDTLLVVLRPLEYDDETSSVETRELTLFVGPHYVVSVRRGGHTPLKNVRYSLDAARGPLRATSMGALHGVLDAVVDHFVVVADALGDDLDDLERRVFTAAGGEVSDVDAAEIYRLKREVSEARRAVAPLVEPVASLARGEVGSVTKRLRPFFADVLDHLVRTEDRVESYERSLTDILSVHLAQVSVQQNADSRRISAWAAMALVPTLIAGIYGMNFTHMPELAWRYGYPYALGLMALVCVVLWRAFKRSGWL
ncbi:magnesium transporter [Quadrisphaera granulorum]|uniref:Magnesium transporter n=1 Tax=Quadrisphaera granulorum TaxID=317664 RepID=A0A316A5H9_9ACTN|nr:magnesium and cobalt transport protein CorA [Quadrisphaera granulorum]PWJ53141.1 magnesium transporter [Quadrisphaera granulorum]SZE97073.1 magnesium transporter [Quadrisphaera granulorum]